MQLVLLCILWSVPDLDVAHSISVLSRYMSNPGPSHWEALKWLLRYLKGSSNVGLTFKHSSEGIKLKGYVDADNAIDRDNRKSVTSYVFTICDTCISWKSQLQHIVALSTTESEYVAITEAVKEALWLKGILKELGYEFPIMFGDNATNCIGNEEAPIGNHSMKRVRKGEPVCWQPKVQISLNNIFCPDDMGRIGTLMNPNPVSNQGWMFV
ncbi:cysteine-rich RLK (RECEPTOR-like protein kinase) 8 [Abeliophyllum distichum]|uniref:Cysteine-rich RLK (RECEPTOR-like protein kinase) 8 n=1 Tax=Abeliophyllum distichum TaxID=126358 RepID=A0ABD1RX91_9LAMI